VAEPGYFTLDKLEEVKAHRATGSAYGRERTSGFAHTLGFWWSVAGLDYYLRYVDEMAGKGAEDLVAYARAYILEKPHVTGVMINPAARRRLLLTERDVMRWAVWQ
jgi:hypothetical protein